MTGNWARLSRHTADRLEVKPSRANPSCAFSVKRRRSSLKERFKREVLRVTRADCSALRVQASETIATNETIISKKAETFSLDG